VNRHRAVDDLENDPDIVAMSRLQQRSLIGRPHGADRRRARRLINNEYVLNRR